MTSPPNGGSLVPPPAEGYRRLHPATPFFDFLGIVARFLLPAIVFIVFARGFPAESWLAIAALPATALSFVRYLFYQYRFADDEIVVREGVLSRQERHIPYERIQNIDISQNPIHRIFGLGEASVETASGTKPEAVLSVLSLASIEEMKGRVERAKTLRAELDAEAEPDAATSETRTEETAPRDAGMEIFRLSVRELLLLGAMSNRSLPFVAGIWGMAWQFDVYETEWFRELLDDIVRIAPGLAEGLSTTSPIFFVITGLGLLIILRILSIVMTFATLYGFVLARSAGDLKTQLGLFTRYSSTIPIRRIQALQVRASLMQRWLGRAAIRVETAGGTSGAAAASRQWVVPLVLERELPRVLEQTHAESSPNDVEWKPLHRQAAMRLVRRQLWIFIIVATPLFYFFRISALPILALFPLLVWRAIALARNMRYGLNDDAVFFRTGWLGRTMTAVLLNKIQAVEIHESPFDRRWKMASLHIDTASAGSADMVRIPFLPVETAHELREHLALEAGRRQFLW